jgi:murein DD-endopeptidase MepM/ murein hydrolase activator NlpD
MNKGMSFGLRGFGAGSAHEAREARLFWSRLMGERTWESEPSSQPLGSIEVYEAENYSGESDEEGELSIETLDEEDADETLPAPRAVLPGDPAPFAPPPPAGSYWPIVTSHRRGREINYQAEDGAFIGANRGRRFLASRSGGSRYHAGIDLFANAGDSVVAITDGRILAFYPFCCGDTKTTNALIVDHGNVVVNYGEVAPDSLTRNGLRVGSTVRAGDVIAHVGVNPKGSSMIHFETYAAGTRRTQRWLLSGTRPPALLNPTPYLLWLLEHGRVPSAQGARGSVRENDPAPSLPPARTVPSLGSGPFPATRDWTRASETERMCHVVNVLVSRYRYPLNGAAGIVGNLYAESGVLPNRVEGSRAATPMRARNFAGVMTDFSAEQIMNRNRSRQEGPRLPGVGLAQWTASARRSGLFQHTFQGGSSGAAILFDMDAQVDYLVSELAARYRAVDRVLRNPSVSLDAASDEVVYNFEVPGAILTTTEPRRKLPRSDQAVIAVFQRRRRHSADALASVRRAPASEDESGEGSAREELGEDWSTGENWPEQVDEEAFKAAVLERQTQNALASGRTRYAPVPESELAVVEGGHRLRREAAQQCRALLSAVRAELAEAQRAGTDSDAARVTQIGIVSSYRDPAYDGRLWHQYYPRYYRETRAQREELVGGPHGDAAVRRLAQYISQRKAAPGFSNHSDGRAVDFTTTEGGVTFGANTSQRVGWRRTWLHRWLVPNAERYGFRPLATEEWHWDFRPTASR